MPQINLFNSLTKLIENEFIATQHSKPGALSSKRHNNGIYNTTKQNQCAYAKHNPSRNRH